MATQSKKRKAQARAQKRRRKTEKRRNQKAKAKTSRKSIGQRYRQQLASLVPAAWNDEDPLDVAVFDEAVFASLPAEQQDSVAAVRTAMELIGNCKYVEANDALKAIPRKDAMSDWRLLVRGVSSWLDNDFDDAEKSFSRLDRERRPARIARALQLARQDDLAELADNVLAQSKTKAGKPGETDEVADDVELDMELVKSARIVRKIRFDRAAIKIAEAGVNSTVPFEDDIPDSTITPEKIKWLKEFGADFRDVEPELVRALELAALHRASEQPYEDVFQETASSFAGPSHDAKNLLRTFLYYMSSEDSDEGQVYLDKYVTEDLPSNKSISDSLRHAMISSIRHRVAGMDLVKFTATKSPFGFMFGGPDLASADELLKSITNNLEKSIKAWPANEEAHEAYVKLLETKVESGDLSKTQKERAIKRLVKAMQHWARSIPNAASPQKYLANFFLEQEQFEDAAPHIKWVTDSRPDDPRLKILPWKSKLCEAMHLCRRKSNLAAVPEVLQQAHALWPAWLSRRWEPYFSAAVPLRAGDQAAFAKQRESVFESGKVKRGSLADACMMLGAAQRMKVPAADLKQLRQPVDLAVKNVKQLSTDELLDAASFFWEMHQTELLYPAFRMHGSKFGKELFNRFKNDLSLFGAYLDDSRFQQAVYWFSELRFWVDGYTLSLPPHFDQVCTKETFMAAAYINCCVKMRFGGRDNRLQETSAFLKESTRKVADPFYRFWFNELIIKAQEKQRESEERFGGGAFGRMFGMDSFEDEFEDEDCDCAECRARRAYESETTNADDPLDLLF
jgi:hypothetical protein